MSKSASFAIKVMLASAFILMFFMWLIMFHPFALIAVMVGGTMASVYSILWLVVHRLFIEKKL